MGAYDYEIRVLAGSLGAFFQGEANFAADRTSRILAVVIQHSDLCGELENGDGIVVRAHTRRCEQDWVSQRADGGSYGSRRSDYT